MLSLIALQDIANSTNMVAAELKRTLQTLACAKYKVLTKHPRGRDISESDQFSFNFGFTAPLAKIRIQTIAAKVETDAERRETESKVDEARNTQCDVSSCSLRSTASGQYAAAVPTDHDRLMSRPAWSES